MSCLNTIILLVNKAILSYDEKSGSVGGNVSFISYQSFTLIRFKCVKILCTFKNQIFKYFRFIVHRSFIG